MRIRTASSDDKEDDPLANVKVQLRATVGAYGKEGVLVATGLRAYEDDWSTTISSVLRADEAEIDFLRNRCADTVRLVPDGGTLRMFAVTTEEIADNMDVIYKTEKKKRKTRKPAMRVGLHLIKGTAQRGFLRLPQQQGARVIPVSRKLNSPDGLTSLAEQMAMSPAAQRFQRKAAENCSRPTILLRTRGKQNGFESFRHITSRLTTAATPEHEPSCPLVPPANRINRASWQIGQVKTLLVSALGRTVTEPKSQLRCVGSNGHASVSEEQKSRWKQLLEFASSIHDEARKGPVLLSDFVTPSISKRKEMEAYNTSVECAAFVLCAYFESCFEFTKSGSDFIVQALPDNHPSSKSTELERIASGETSLVDMADSILVGRQYEVMLTGESATAANELALVLPGCRAYTLALAEYTRKLRKLFTDHAGVRYALARPQPGTHVVYQQQRCRVEASNNNGILQMRALDTCARFERVRASEVFDPLFPLQYRSFPALALRANLLLPEPTGKLSDKLACALESLKYRICKAHFVSRDGSGVFEVKLGVSNTSNTRMCWLPENLDSVMFSS